MIMLGMALLSLQASTQSAGDSLLKNPGFEVPAETPAAWDHTGPIDGVTYLWESGVSRSGQRSIGLEKTSNRFFPIARWYQTIPYDGHSRAIEFTGWVKAEGMSKAVLDVEFEGTPESAHNNSGRTHHWVAYIGHKNPTDPPTTHDWSLCGGVATIPAGTKTITVSLQDHGPGKVWLDDVRAQYTTAAQTDPLKN